MDQLVQMHRTFLKQVTAFCMLDVQGKLLAKEIYLVLQIVLDFRLLVQGYLLDDNENTHSDDEMSGDSFDRVGALCVTQPEFY